MMRNVPHNDMHDMQKRAWVSSAKPAGSLRLWQLEYILQGQITHARHRRKKPSEGLHKTSNPVSQEQAEFEICLTGLKR